LRSEGREWWAKHAAEADVTSRRVDGLREARRGPIAEAVVRRAQERAPFQYLAWKARRARVEALLARRPHRVARDAARPFPDRRVRVVGREPGRGPFPHVAGHVVETEVVRREAADR